MKTIFFLGNIGAKYTHTRHNAAWIFADNLVAFYSKNSVFLEDKKLAGFTCKIIIGGNSVLCVKPTTLMNRSANCVQRTMQQYKLKKEDIIVAYDDLDIPIGKIRMQPNAYPKIHNGVNSVKTILSDFLSIRIGVDNRGGDRSMPADAYVLNNFTVDEFAVLKTSIGEFLGKQILVQALA
jgi:peptidyl-tRNA hydrolase, PTH1 family